MFQILVFAFFGIIVGLIVGILPGIHPNQIFVALISMLPLLSGLSSAALLSFVLSVAVSNILFNYIPSIFFSVPDPNTVLNVLPGHKMVLEGKGLDALFISLSSASITLIICALTLPVFLYLIPLIHKLVYPYIHFLLIGVSGWLIMMEQSWKERFLSLTLFILSGVWGIFCLNSVLINSELVLFPSLTGMFGVAGLLMSAKEVAKLPTQRFKKEVDIGDLKKVVVTALTAGLLVGILPGAGESQAGVFVSEFTGLNQKEFLGSLAGINMSNAFFAIISLYSFGKTRSGTAVAVEQIVPDFNLNFLLFSVGIILVSGGVSVILTWYTGKKMLGFLERINYRLASYIILGFTIFMVFWFTNFIGVFTLLVSTALGLLAILWNVKRTSNMGFLLMSTIFHFSGLNYIINSILF